jgi:ABC-2 type transport system ATP-binding protein
MAEHVVETRSLTKRYGEFVALDSLSIHVDRGQILGFIGPNGAGKTTTIKVLVGLSKPTSGSAYISGVDCSGKSSHIKRLVGYMPDRFGSYDNMRVHEYLDFFAAIFGITRSQRRKRIADVMEITDTTYMQDKFVESLSHGMQQRVGIARTLLHDPEVLILDEPANGLDPKARIDMRELLLRLAAEGKTLIVTSHILPELARICNSVAIITGGKLRAFGPLDDIMRSICPLRSYEVQLALPEQVDRSAMELSKHLRPSEPLTISKAERTLRFPTARTETELAQLLQHLIAADVAIAQYREVASDLEDAFLMVAEGTRDKTLENTPSATPA